MNNLKNYLFTSESVSEGHPDKVSDRISDMVVDSYLSGDPFSRVACETLTTTNKVVLAGEVRGPKIKNDVLRGRKFGFQLEELRQWLLIYDQDGTEIQMEVFLGMAERKLKELKEQQVQLAETLEELEKLRKITSNILQKEK